MAGEIEILTARDLTYFVGHDAQGLAGRQQNVARTPWPVGKYVIPDMSSINSGNHSTSAFTIFVPIIIPQIATVDFIGIALQTAASGAAVRLALYSDNEGVPDQKQFETGEVDLSAGAGSWRGENPHWTPPAPGLYWACVMAKAASTQFQATRIGGGSGKYILMGDIVTGNQPPRYYSAPTAYGNMPQTADSVVPDNQNNGVVVGLRRGGA